MSASKIYSPVREFRKRRGLTIEQMAFRCGISQRTVYRIEMMGHTNLHRSLMLKIAYTLHIHPARLFFADTMLPFTDQGNPPDVISSIRPLGESDHDAPAGT